MCFLHTNSLSPFFQRPVQEPAEILRLPALPPVLRDAGQALGRHPRPDGHFHPGAGRALHPEAPALRVPVDGQHPLRHPGAEGPGQEQNLGTHVVRGRHGGTGGDPAARGSRVLLRGCGRVRRQEAGGGDREVAGDTGGPVVVRLPHNRSAGAPVLAVLRGEADQDLEGQVEEGLMMLDFLSGLSFFLSVLF